MFSVKHPLLAIPLLVLALPIAWAEPDSSAAAAQADNRQAMDQMMAAMHMPSSGDVDRDFVTQMTAHHQGAIDMARIQLRYGHNERLRRLAQEIIVTQQQEIAVMQQALSELPASPTR
ncbi:CopM family metallochaperone [Pseudomonas oryzihabitans]|uniref:DUF305 domain-containing protein n=1 Tax=Pseudomonas oryzihabitans TaxID=47885 RepID=A0ABX3IU59_9PSED|nr:MULTISPECIES: DUF305 domain-containing protein [Pseudomonas]KTT49848.1 hypothetical protein SB11R_10410 [Pseudomonas psychrotolerans]MDT3723261.1 DUF305 domain-containing protein [Pseudomonas oryzihabitans]NMY91830.1 DUF305 domain-containing protein [Pseudomonas psychrotolerans]NMY91957.1 DUF305 domain-containing protein [Pseudomonas psychrotolerans]ONN71263.1 hypothetical protein BVL52_11595 [Pseudomonas psychrotolerans]